MNERRGAFPSGLQFTLRNKQLSFTNVNMSAHSDMRKTSGSDLELQHRSRKVVRKHFKPRLTSELQRTTVSSTLKPDLEEVKEPNKTATNQLQRCCKLKKWWHIDRHSEKCGKLSTCQRTRVEQSRAAAPPHWKEPGVDVLSRQCEHHRVHYICWLEKHLEDDVTPLHPEHMLRMQQATSLKRAANKQDNRRS